MAYKGAVAKDGSERLGTESRVSIRLETKGEGAGSERLGTESRVSIRLETKGEGAADGVRGWKQSLQSNRSPSEAAGRLRGF